MERKMATKDWSALDDLVLEEISRQLTLSQDFSVFRRVCTSWLSAAPKENFKFKSRMPWLLIPPKRGCNLGHFFIFPQVQVQGIAQQQQQQRRVLLDTDLETYNMLLSSKGWLLTKLVMSTSLLHPLSGAQIKLPEFPWCDRITIRKFCLSSNPSLTLDYTLMMIHGVRRELIYSIKPGDTAWTIVDTGRNDNVDLTYCKGKFYIVNRYCQIMVYDVKGVNPTVARVAYMPIPDNLGNVYIVESSGRLLVVTQQLLPEELAFWETETAYRACEFQVFEVDLSTNSWTKMKDLGNKTLFLGSNSSICIESDGVYFKPNRIFFMDAYRCAYYFKKKGGYHIRVYNIEDRSIEPYFLGDSSDRLSSNYNFTTPPTFIEQCSY
ncbi:hypothetical protein Ddye_014122 [Dipteronia dyeriana]|uniref:KIB1-4 beta-propeller domain-containing protein n=1 Tax=Dipteronia dyeriana TaxID=168575 RepID=A0AAE0CKB4_9ROSI|nr:hypothetical protein Ddye_014122 [Dipteronia dyeriana]